MCLLKKKLKAQLKDSKKVAVLGIGSPILGDDALGPFFIEEFKKRLKPVSKSSNGIRLPLMAFDGSLKRTILTDCVASPRRNAATTPSASLLAEISSESNLGSRCRISEQVLKKVKKRLPIKLFSCETVPENYTGEIKKFKPTHIIIIDAAEMGREAGEICLLDKEEKSVEASFSTHRPHRKALIEYLCRSLNCRIISICIQVKTIQFGAPLSREVEKAVRKIAGIISDLVSVKE